jgi:hypothetical protein
MRRTPSPAMVVACTALVVALGGTGYAAIKLPRNSVGAKQLRPNAVTSGKVRNGSLQAKDFARSQLPRGPSGPQGPPGTSSGATSLGFASRDPVAAGSAIDVGTAPVDLLSLAAPAGTAGYVASSGPVTASGPGRLIADAQVVILDAAATRANVSCSIALVGSEVRPIGNYVNANIEPDSGYVPVAVSAGAEVAAGTYDVRVRCATTAPSVTFHRGNLTVALASR